MPNAEVALLQNYLLTGAIVFAIGLLGFLARRNLIVMFLSAEMMLRHLGWNDAADLIINGMNGAIQAKTVTYDFERLMDDATLVSCSAFGESIVAHM